MTDSVCQITLNRNLNGTWADLINVSFQCQPGNTRYNMMALDPIFMRMNYLHTPSSALVTSVLRTKQLIVVGAKFVAFTITPLCFSSCLFEKLWSCSVLISLSFLIFLVQGGNYDNRHDGSGRTARAAPSWRGNNFVMKKEHTKYQYNPYTRHNPNKLYRYWKQVIMWFVWWLKQSDVLLKYL